VKPVAGLVLVVLTGVAGLSACSTNRDPSSKDSSATAQQVAQFSGVYRVESTVSAVSGSYDETVGVTHTYTWTAVADCRSAAALFE
jgi:hypothetical protein